MCSRGSSHFLADSVGTYVLLEELRAGDPRIFPRSETTIADALELVTRFRPRVRSRLDLPALVATPNSAASMRGIVEKSRLETIAQQSICSADGAKWGVREALAFDVPEAEGPACLIFESKITSSELG